LDDKFKRCLIDEGLSRIDELQKKSTHHPAGSYYNVAEQQVLN